MISTKMVISSTINLLRIFAKQNENNIFKIFQNPTAEGLTKARFLKFHHIYKNLYDIELELIKVWVFFDYFPLSMGTSAFDFARQMGPHLTIKSKGILNPGFY